MTRSNPRFQITLITDKILAEFAREYLLDQSGKVGIPYYRSLQALLARLQFKMPLEIQIVINMCSKFMLCLGDYPNGQLLLDAPLKKELEKKANTATRDAFCTTYGKALMLRHKDKPDICPNYLTVCFRILHACVTHIITRTSPAFYPSNKEALNKSLTVKMAFNVKVIVIIKYYVN